MPPRASASPSRSGAVLARRDSENLIRRSWHAMADVFSPFSSSALAKLPNTNDRFRDRSTRTDLIPEPQDTNGAGQNQDYHSVNPVRVPKKIATAVRVEGKVWFANERTWLSYVNISVLIGTLALALFNASDDWVARNFAYTYALISIGVLIYGWAIYQKRITMIRKRDPGHFDQILGPVIISALLFFAVLANFIIRGSHIHCWFHDCLLIFRKYRLSSSRIVRYF
ncbi:hypothetical protein BD410DRAFT_716908 [Rickenella mellea]|uniref:DUF202 domain-containing protein n=1 Tax=Rickenella mellea TaxID=50990 RepID=A0A4Y7QD70_9AGAM|nr:hypothetical protein BD410DRAFT_716908 [Rickenella mellea]